MTAAAYNLGKEYIERRNKVLAYALCGIVSLNIVWGLTSVPGYTESAAIIQVVLVGSGVAGVGAGIYLAITENIERTVTVATIFYMGLLIFDFVLGLNSGEYVVVVLSVLFIANIQIKGWRGVILPLLAFIISCLLLIIAYQLPTSAPEGSIEYSILPPIPQAGAILLILLAPMYRIVRQDKKEVDQKNKDLIKANQQISEKISMRKEEEKKLSKQKAELERLVEAMKKRETAIQKLEGEQS